MIRSLIVGLTHVDPATHGGWDGRAGCWGSDDDANLIVRLTEKAGYYPTNQAILLNEQATRAEFSAIVRTMAALALPCDHTNIYYSGHGGQVRDQNGDEEDGRDETLCFYDFDLVDDSVWGLLQLFPEKSTVFLMTDSCHSGSNFRSRSRLWPFHFGPRVRRPLRCGLIHIAACRDSETADGLEQGGAATLAMADALRNGESASYETLFHGMKTRLRGQRPVLTAINASAEFLLARPFTGGAHD